MGRGILLITTDQQRYDTLGCNGALFGSTPVIDGLAASGIRYERCHPQSVVCMPSRSTIITGQHPSTHGVWMNGVALPADAPSVAEELRASGRRTALIGKPHFEPFIDPFGRFPENQFVNNPLVGSHRGFEHFESATHGAVGPLHYAAWLRAEHPEAIGMFYPVLDPTFEVNTMGGGDTGAPQAHVNAIPTEWYHTDWVAERTISWLNSLDSDEDWFCWMSFPDPHHPWDPPEREMHRVNWRDVDLPAGYERDATRREAILDAKPRQWGAWYRGEIVSNYEAPLQWVPKTLTEDQIREVNARNAVEVELIDAAIGRVLSVIDSRGDGPSTDVVFTTDHGEFQGDFGLLFKGPCHTDSLMRLPLIWRPAPDRGVEPAVVTEPVGLVDIAPTLCQVAGLEAPGYMEGKALPIDSSDAEARKFERVLTEWDSALFGVSVHLRTITRDGWTATVCLPSTMHEGTEGELYDLVHDPLQHTNLWDDPEYRSTRDDLISDLWDHQPPQRQPLGRVNAPV